MSFVANLDTANTVWRQNTNQVVEQEGHRALLRALVHYAAGKASIGTVTYLGTGTGTIDDIDGGVDAPTETWTISFTDATNFTVTGSTSGAQSGGTVGSNYTTSGDPLTSLLSFRIEAGGTPFQSGDAFTVPVTVGALSGQGEQWVLDRWSPFTTAGGGFNAIDDRVNIGTTGALIWHGLGNGSEAFHAGLALVETPASQIWNFSMRGFTGFSASQNWDTNLGFSPETFVALWDNDMTYWFVVNARRIVGVWVVSTTMHAMYQGAILPFASPQEWPFPMANIGEKDDEEAWNSGAADFTQGIITASADNGVLRNPAGVWVDWGTTSTDYQLWPFSTSAGNMRNVWGNNENLPSGDNQLLPITLANSFSVATAPLEINTIGVLDGCYAATGFNLSPQTVLNIGGTDYLVVNDIGRLERDDFWALELS